MQKVSLLIVLFGGMTAGLMAGLLLPTEQREKLSRRLATSMEGMVEHCPGG
jgi:hypothetical protein